MKHVWLTYSARVFPISMILLSACIEQYFPDRDELKPGTLVVRADLTDEAGIQSIHISRSSTIVYPEYDPQSGCFVSVENEAGESREFSELEPGQYTGNLDQDFLIRGTAYRLEIITRDGTHYESDFEQLLPVPAIESVYFAREDRATRDPEIIEEGVQFYMDFEIRKDSGRYLRWKLIETYEIHNPENQAWIYDVDRVSRELPDSSSWYTCWITRELPDLYTLDLGNIDGEVYRSLPLNYVSTETRRLNIRYSLLIEQLALSRTAFFYWDELAKNIQSQGNLFDTQPALTPGNICNVNDTEEMVIGFFSISGHTQARIYVENVPGLEVRMDPNYCAPGAPPAFLYYMHDRYLPVYTSAGWNSGEWTYGEVHKYCVDCREYKESTHIKPDFW